MTRYLRYLLPSLADVIFVCILFYISFAKNVGMLHDGDTGYHIRAGEYILDTFTIPRIDPYSFITPPMQWTVHEWLAEIIMAVAHRLSGLSGVIVLYSVILAATFYVMVRSLKSAGISALPAAVATIAIFAASTLHWLARPHVFSFLIIVMWLHILNSYEERGRNQLYLLPLLMLFWVNLHGGYIIGFVFICIYLAGNLLLIITDKEAWRNGGMKRAKWYGSILPFCMGTAILNPFGWKIFLFPFKLVFDKYQMDHTQEFLSPNFHEQPLFKGMLLLLILLLAFSKKRLTMIQIALLIFFTNMALYSVRYIPLFAIIVVPVMLHYMELDFGERLPRVRAFFRKRLETVAGMDAMSSGFFWPVAAILLVCFQLQGGGIAHGFDPKIKAVDAVNFLKREPIPGRMFNNDEIGDLIIYGAHRQYKVFIDGRLDMYGTERIKEYKKVQSFSAGWEDVFKKYEISWVIFDTDSPLTRYLLARKEWRLIYSDKVASILVIDTPAYADLIARYPNVQLARVEDKDKKKE